MIFFLNYGRLSSAQLDRWQAPMQQPIIDQHPVKQTAYRRDIKDNGYKSVFTNSWLVRQRNRSWIKGLGKNPQKSEFVDCWQCLLSGATEPYTRQPAQWHATGDVLTRLLAKTHQNRNACLDALRSPFPPKKMHVYTVSNANWLSKRKLFNVPINVASPNFFFIILLVISSKFVFPQTITNLLFALLCISGCICFAEVE